MQLARQILSPPPAISAAAGAERQETLRGLPYMLRQAKETVLTSSLSLGGSPPLEWFVLNDVVMGGQSESVVGVAPRPPPLVLPRPRFRR